jgi:hypothetical protein
MASPCGRRSRRRRVAMLNESAASRDDDRIPTGVRIVLAFFGVAVLLVAGWLWIADPTPTIKTTIETTTEATEPEGERGRQTSTARTITKTINGRTSQEADAAPSDTASQRSEVVSVALLALAGIPLFLAAMGQWPTKLGAGRTTAEWGKPQLTSDQLGDAVAAVAARMPDQADETTIKEVVREAVRTATHDKWEAFFRGTTPETTGEGCPEHGGLGTGSAAKRAQ